MPQLRRKRTSCWQHHNGKDATIAQLGEVLGKNIDCICDKGVGICDSIQFKHGGYDEDALMASSALIGDLLCLDPRGGIFKQSDMMAALESVITSEQRARLFDHATMEMQDTKEAMLLTIYKIRVMLSQVRAAYDDGRSDDSKLKTFFTIIDSATRVKKSRKTDRLGTKPHPFLSFRGEAAESEEEEEEEITMITKFYCGVTRKAFMLGSDGFRYHANQYKAGQSGFVEAVWLKPAAVLELEIPIARLQDGVIMAVTADAKKRIRTKAAAQAAAVEVELAPDLAEEVAPAAAAESFGEAAAASDEAVGSDGLNNFQFKTVKGHGLEFTVQIRNSNNYNDKAQVLSCSAALVEGKDRTPMQVCDEITARLNTAYTAGDFALVAPLKDCKDLISVRSFAVLERDKLL